MRFIEHALSTFILISLQRKDELVKCISPRKNVSNVFNMTSNRRISHTSERFS